MARTMGMVISIVYHLLRACLNFSCHLRLVGFVSAVDCVGSSAGDLYPIMPLGSLL